MPMSMSMIMLMLRLVLVLVFMLEGLDTFLGKECGQASLLRQRVFLRH